MGRYPACWGGSGGEASTFLGLPWGCDTIHFQMKQPVVDHTVVLFLILCNI